ncbi:MAG: hypothetical protein ACK5DY_02795 [Bacteroidota bacterium]|jgi:hypothetical protein
MKIKLLIATLGIVISSCSVTTKLKTTQQKLNRQSEANASNAKVLNKPIVADLDVAMKREKTIYKCTSLDINNSVVSGSSTPSKKNSFLISSIESMRNEVKNRSQFKFMEDFKCDYVVDPIYKIETETLSGSSVINFTVEISAYPAFYKKFSQPDSLPKSIFQASKIDNRDIPLMTNSSNNEKTVTEQKSTKGLIFGPSISSLKDGITSFGSYGDTLKMSIGGIFGYHSTIGNKVGFRFEIYANTRSFKVMNSPNNITGRSFGFSVPLMLNLAATKNIQLHAGPVINTTLFGFQRETNEITNITNNFSWEDLTRIQMGFCFGAIFQSNGAFGMGLRQEASLGSDKWSITSLVLNFNL